MLLHNVKQGISMSWKSLQGKQQLSLQEDTAAHLKKSTFHLIIF